MLLGEIKKKKNEIRKQCCCFSSKVQSNMSQNNHSNPQKCQKVTLSQKNKIKLKMSEILTQRP